MKISELSRRTQTPVPTIKYYIREGLLPRGEPLGRTQARYGEGHVERLLLIRSLREVADLPIAVIRETLQAAEESPSGEQHDSHLGVALAALSPELDVPAEESSAYEEASARVDRLLEALGWELRPAAPGRIDLVRALVAIGRSWPTDVSDDHLLAYGRIADQLASIELPDDWDPGADPTGTLSYAVLGTVLFEPVVVAFRRLAHAERSRRLAADQKR